MYLVLIVYNKMTNDSYIVDIKCKMHIFALCYIGICVLFSIPMWLCPIHKTKFDN